ncbi:MAG: hypothetical protein LAP21_05740 [Acidobacteriia bacterium]|nr:hypothetical protein [Terriglobia bacterium]
MKVEVIEVQGFEVEVTAELYCAAGGEHRALVEQARTDRRKLGHNVEESAVLCLRCAKAIPLRG